VLVGQTDLNGSLPSYIEANEYIVDGNITIDAGNSSHIEAGTKFLFDGPYSFTVNGSITVDGAQGDSVYFINNDPDVSDENKWLGILIDGAPSSSSINYARVSGVNDNDDMPDVNIDGYAIKVQYSNLSLSNLLVTQNSRGVYLYTANPTIDNLHSMYNAEHYGGLRLGETAIPVISNSKFNHNTGIN
ncbi:uncharacterized protein METZ01_LOCUS451718, partial [marine metagenome]